MRIYLKRNSSPLKRSSLLRPARHGALTACLGTIVIGLVLFVAQHPAHPILALVVAVCCGLIALPVHFGVAGLARCRFAPHATLWLMLLTITTALAPQPWLQVAAAVGIVGILVRCLLDPELP